MTDLTFLKTFTKGDTLKMKRYIKLYLQQAPGILDAIKANIEKEDWEQVRIQAHALKPQAEYMGAAQLKESLAGIEVAVSGASFELVPILYQEVLRFYRESEVYLKKVMVGL